MGPLTCAFPHGDWAYFPGDNLFEPFQRLHSDGALPGTGIGLSIVQRTIDRHGGRAWVKAAECKGASF